AVVEDLDLRRPAARRAPAECPIEVGRDDDRDARPARHERPLEVGARRDRSRVERARRGELGHQPAAGRGAVRVEDGEREVLDRRREHEAEDQERAERHDDEDRRGERVAERRPDLAADERPQASPAHAGAPEAASRRRKTSFIWGCWMSRRAPAATRRSSAASTGGSSAGTRIARPPEVAATSPAMPPRARAALSLAAGGNPT